jgi:hypothetical protein
MSAIIKPQAELLASKPVIDHVSPLPPGRLKKLKYVFGLPYSVSTAQIYPSVPQQYCSITSQRMRHFSLVTPILGYCLVSQGFPCPFTRSKISLHHLPKFCLPFSLAKDIVRIFSSRPGTIDVMPRNSHFTRRTTLVPTFFPSPVISNLSSYFFLTFRTFFSKK